MWDLIVSVPDHCLSFYFKSRRNENSSEILAHGIYRSIKLFLQPIQLLETCIITREVGNISVYLLTFHDIYVPILHHFRPKSLWSDISRLR